MILFLGIQGTYQDVHVGIFNNTTLVQHATISNTHTSKQLIPTINTLLESCDLKLENLSFVAATQGPGPFSTLRTILTTVNAIHFACETPLVGIDGLRASAQEHQDPDYPRTIMLLDAFNNDVYFCIPDILVQEWKHKDKTSCDVHNAISIATAHTSHDSIYNTSIYDSYYHTGYCTIDALLSYIHEQYDDTTINDRPVIRFLGNGSSLHKHKIEARVPRCYLPDAHAFLLSLPFMAELSMKAWKKNMAVNQLLPLYLKKHHAER